MSSENVGYINSQINLSSNHEVQFKSQNKWKSMSSLEKALIFFSILCLGTVVGLAVAYGLLRSKTGADSSENKICLKKGCILAASNLLQSMDLTADPCNDFYQYACGDWMDRNSIPDHQYSYSSFVHARDEGDLVLRTIFEDTSEEPPSNVVKMVKDAYEACMNTSVIEDLKGEPIMAVLHQLMGVWPVLVDVWEPSTFEWIRVVAKTRLYGKSYIIGFDVAADLKNSSMSILSLDQPESFGLPRNYFSKEVYQIEYEETMINIAKLLYNGTLSDKHKKDIHNILTFEMELVEITKPPEERRNHSAMYTKTSLSKMQKQYDKIDFKLYFTLILPSDIILDENEPVIIYNTEYFEKLNDLLNKTDKRILANYIGWRFVNDYKEHLSKAFVPDEITRWRKCVGIVNANFPMVVGLLYVMHNFLPESKEVAKLLIKNIRISFEKQLKENDWMDNETKRLAIEKLNKMDEKVAYPDDDNYPEELAKEYEGLKISAADHFSNQLDIDQFNANRGFKDLRKGQDIKKWLAGPADINAYYHGNTNSITFPAGILQEPFFDAERPRSMNFGAIGMLIGHEITHGFDDQGSQLDYKGNLFQWWKHETEEKFKKKKSCIINQYNSYFVPQFNMSVNGIITQGENIADNGGLKAAYMAYKMDQEANGTELLLPGLKFSHDQLFFLGFANIWCSIEKPFMFLDNLLTDDHSPNRFRVIGSLSNSLQFRTAFNCKKGSNMYLEERCSVW